MTDTSNDPTGSRPALPAPVILIVVEEARRFGVDPKDLWRLSSGGDASRLPPQRARHAVWRRLRDDRGWSYPRIARLFGVSHAAVMYGVKQARLRSGEASACA